MDKGALFPSSEGTPQGGVISPLLANITLHGMHNSMYGMVTSRSTKYPCGRGMSKQRKFRELTFVRYGDDFVVLHPELEVIQKAKEILSEWLMEYGLDFNENKTRIKHTLLEYEGQRPGFDFLGFNIRQYSFGKYRIKKNTLALSHITLCKPSKDNLKAHVRSLKQVFAKCQNQTAKTLILQLNPRIEG